MSATIAGDEWLKDDDLRSLLEILNGDGEEARIAGGAVRDALLGGPVSDIDIATTCLPAETIRRAGRAGCKTAPTGVEHGTVTVIVRGRPFEVTTLRKDIDTDGRRATVEFGRDWPADAARRDFTINGLYADADGAVVDLVGGVADIERRIVRFIGDAETRIREDYLRILRFFRFFAWYGDGGPDAGGLKACARLKSGLDGLSAERVWAELKKLLSAPDPSRALLWMRQAGVLTAVLPETGKWGIDAIHGLVAAENALGWDADPLLRLESMLPPDGERLRRLGRRLKMSGAERNRLENWAATPTPAAALSGHGFERLIYRGDRRALCDSIRLALASARGRTDDSAMTRAGGYARLLAVCENWRRPVFPVSGGDLLALGLEPGVRLGGVLAGLEAEWVDANFRPDKRRLLDRAGEMIAEGLD